MKENKPIKTPDEQPSFNKKNHLKRSIANQPNHLKSKVVKGLLSKEELEEYNDLIFPTDTKNLGS